MTIVENLSQFHFIRPWALLLAVPFCCLILQKLRCEDRKNRWLQQLPPHLSKALLLKNQGWTNQLPLKVLGIIGLMAVIVISGPSWYRQASPFADDASPLVVILDVSETMLEKDVPPSRLFMAKQKIRQLLEEHRVTGPSGLIVYAGSAHLASPLTQDRSVYGPILDSITVEVMPRQGKYAQYAISVLERLLREQPVNGTILLVTDALNLEAEQAYQRYFQSSPYQLVIYGVGNPNNPALFPLDEDTLTDVAASAGGHYLEMTVNNTDLQQNNQYIEKYQRLNEDSTQPWVDAGYYLVWPILFVYLMWFRKGWLVQWVWIIGLVLPLTIPHNAEASTQDMVDIWLTKDQKGRWLLERDEPGLAAGQFRDNKWKAYSSYIAGDYKKAQQYYLMDDSLTGQLGLAASLAQQREYVAARSQYREILKVYPNNSDALNNLKVVENIIAHIEQFTQSQSDNTERQKSRELNSHPKTSDGVTQELDQEQLIEEKWSADDLISDPQVHERWMRRVQGDLSDFMASKFAVQLQRGDATQADWGKDVQ